MAITINGSGTIGGLSVGGLPAGTVNTASLAAGSVTTTTLASGAVNTSILASSSVTTAKMGYTGAVIQIVRNYDDTVTTAGSGSNFYTYWMTTYITLIRSDTAIFINGIFCSHATDDSSVTLQYNVNGGSWNGNSILNSQAYTYSGLGDTAWAHKSNNGPFPFPLHNFMTASSIGASAGSVVGVRVANINENNTCYFNRGTEGTDNSVNYATARSTLSLWEVLV